MEFFAPFMLFLLQPGDGVAEAELVRHPVLFETEEECLAAADELKAADLQATGATPQTFCIAMPDPSEFAALHKAMRARHEESRDASN